MYQKLLREWGPTRAARRLIPLLIGLLLVACGSAGNSTAGATTSSARPVAIATTTHIEDILGVVAGDRVTVVGLVPRNGDPHEFEPTPDDVRRVTESRAVFKNGGGLEGWIDELLANAGGERPIIDVSQGLPLARIDRAFEEGGETDPHIWMNPINMLTAVDNIVAGLKQIDPAGAATFDGNAAAYKEQLRALDTEVEQALAAIPPERRKLVTAHDALGYFAQRYDFQIIGALIPSVSTEAAETSAQQVSALVQQIRDNQIPAIFAEASNNPKFIEQVAAEAGVKVVPDLHVDSLGERGGPAGSYLDWFRSDVQKIVAALR